MNKLILSFLLCIFIFSSVKAFVSIEPFAVYPNEEVKIVVEDPEIESISITAFYNLKELRTCTKESCPLFENNELEIEGKGEHSIKINNSKPGNYLIKITLSDSSSYYSSFVVKPDYRWISLALVILLIALLVLVETNVFSRKNKKA
ncbi:MAG: hypothetical protein ABIE23_04990 [archaeon]